MIAGQPSETALHVAAARAAQLRFDEAPHLLEDTLAVELLGPEKRALVEDYGNSGPWILIENRLFIPLRARYVEDRLAAGYARGIRQFVILGAGLDSFALRQPPGYEDLRIFEVDHPDSQRWKTERLASLGWSIPDNTELVACDFARTPASRALAKTRFDPAAPAIVSWFGVIYYLEEPVAARTLADLADHLAAGSELCFDAMRPWQELPERYHQLREAMGAFLAGAGEPHVNRYSAAELEETLRVAGFSDVTIEARSEIERRYLAPRNEKTPLSERFHLVTAIR